MDTNYLASLASSVTLVVPEAIVILAACVYFAVAPFFKSDYFWSRTSLLLMVLSLFLLTPAPPELSANGLFRSDSMSIFCRWLGFLVGGALVMLSMGRVSDQAIPASITAHCSSLLPARTWYQPRMISLRCFCRWNSSASRRICCCIC